MKQQTARDPTSLGLNRTGIGTSPIDIKAMLANRDEPSTPGSAADFLQAHAVFLKGAEPIGTMPPPATLKGVAQSALQAIKGDRPMVFVDKLGERMAFERAGARLYDLMINKCSERLDELAGATSPVDIFRQIRSEEVAHLDLLIRVARRLGADPTVVTPSADVTGVIGLGLAQVLADPRTTVGQSLQALLVAELADNDGWDMLIRLADEMGLQEDAASFREALREEERHLLEIRTLLSQAVMGEAKVVH